MLIVSALSLVKVESTALKYTSRETRSRAEAGEQGGRGLGLAREREGWTGVSSKSETFNAQVANALCPLPYGPRQCARAYVFPRASPAAELRATESAATEAAEEGKGRGKGKGDR